jgi:phage terminase small subunit
MKDAHGYAQLRADIRRDFGLSNREARFVMELVVDENASAAYVRAGYAEKNANDNAARLTAKDSIQAATAHVRAKIAERVGYSAEEALEFVANVLRADPRELVSVHVGACRFCHGPYHLYQRTDGEMARDRVRHAQAVARRQERNKDYKDPGFDEQGGGGYDMRREPHTECPDCGGDGVSRVAINDTRKISKAAAALFAGVKEGKDGIEVKMIDKAVMVDKMYRYHGLYEADNRQSAAQAADPAALIALSEAMDRSREERRAVMARRAQEGFTGD